MLMYELGRAIQADRDRQTAASLRRNALLQEVAKDVDDDVDYDVEMPRPTPANPSRASMSDCVGVDRQLVGGMDPTA